MRNLSTVIDQLRAQIPDTETSFHARLLDRQDSIPYTAPEAMGVRWKEVACILQAELGSDPTSLRDWKQTVYNIWMGKV